jgi:hypothetical protein
MRIFDEMRGHFALLTKRQLETLAEQAQFIIVRVVSTSSKQSDWTVVIRPVNSKYTNAIYLSDVLRVYTYLLSERWKDWIKLDDIQSVIEKSRINIKQSSYIMALLATFDDVESRKGKDAAIRYIAHREIYGLAVK